MEEKAAEEGEEEATCVSGVTMETEPATVIHEEISSETSSESCASSKVKRRRRKMVNKEPSRSRVPTKGTNKLEEKNEI